MLQIAKILKSHGTDGGVLIGLYDITASEIDLQEPVFIEFDGLPVPFFIEDIQTKGTSKAVVHLTDVSSLEDAEEIVGRSVMLEGEWEDEQEEDFIGWTVLDKGRQIGTVTDFEDIPGNPCIDVQTASGEVMIPLHEDFVISVDPEGKTLDLDIPEGLY